MDGKSATTEQLLTLRIGGELFGLPSDLVREVGRLPKVARVPHAPPALLGVANIRGAVVPVLSLAKLVERDAGDERRVVVVDAGEPVGLAVEEVAHLVRADAAEASGVRSLDVTKLVAHGTTGAQRRSARTSIAEDRQADRAGADMVPLVVFAIGNQEFALPLGVVEEVLRLPDDVARMPHADAAIVGTMLVRGTLLPLLSLKALLALPGKIDASRARIIVVTIGSHRVGLVVDAMRAILRVAEEAIDPVPQVLARGSAEARIQAICRIDEGKRLVSVLAAEHLLRDDLTARLLETSGEQLDMAETQADDRSEQFLLFRIGEDEFGLPIAAVEEIAPLPSRLARLPKAPAFVQGVMNLRGEVVPVIDQVQRFGGAAASARKARVIIVRIGDLKAGFVVDAASEVLRVEQDALRPAPDLGNEETRVFDRVANLSDQQRIVLIVSPKELLDRAEQDVLRSLGQKDATPSS